jgi:hypothetical protein
MFNEEAVAGASSLIHKSKELKKRSSSIYSDIKKEVKGLEKVNGKVGGVIAELEDTIKQLSATKDGLETLWGNNVKVAETIRQTIKGDIA